MTEQLTAQVTLQTVTPMFLGGSEPRGGLPEMRPASFKGELRYWWRALWGGVQPDCSPNELAEHESRVFGSTDSASPIVLRLLDEPPKQEPWPFGDRWPGVNYLFFSMKGNRQDPDRIGFAEKQSFRLILQTRLGLRDEKRINDAFLQACAALWLFVRLGSVGARARRGAGNVLAVAGGEGWPEALPPLPVRANSAAEFARETSAGLAQLYQALGWPTPSAELKSWPEFDILHPRGAPLYVLGKEWNSWQAALDQVGLAYRDFRSRRSPDYANVKPVVAGQTTQMGPVERAAFGLPIVFYYRSLGGQRGTLEGKDVDRRASPLVFHVTQLANGKYIVNLVRFNSRLLPKGSGLRLKPRGRPVFAKPPDGKIITEFLQSIGEPGHKDKQGDFYIAPMLDVRYPGQEATA
jgi:CRISPR-associated protein Cmr1